jgi:hypothetical protein
MAVAPVKMKKRQRSSRIYTVEERNMFRMSDLYNVEKKYTKVTESL